MWLCVLWYKLADGRFGRSYTAIFRIWHSGSITFRSGVTSQNLSCWLLWYPQTWHMVLFYVVVLWGPQMHTETEKSKSDKRRANIWPHTMKTWYGWGVSQGPATVWHGAVAELWLEITNTIKTLRKHRSDVTSSFANLKPQGPGLNLALLRHNSASNRLSNVQPWDICRSSDVLNFRHGRR